MATIESPDAVFLAIPLIRCIGPPPKIRLPVLPVTATWLLAFWPNIVGSDIKGILTEEFRVVKADRDVPKSDARILDSATVLISVASHHYDCLTLDEVLLRQGLSICGHAEFPVPMSAVRNMRQAKLISQCVNKFSSI